MARKRGARRHETADEERAWWAPKRYGYGASPPIAWQGWLVTLAYALLIVGAAYGILPRSIVAFVAITVGATAALLLIAARRTRGGWRWRWRWGERA